MKNRTFKILLGLSITSILLLSGCDFFSYPLSSELSSESSEEISSESSEELSSDSSESSSEISSSEDGNTDGDGVLKNIYTIGFEAKEGYVAATEYQNTTVKSHGPENYQWGVLMGTPSTTDKISGEQSIQMRYYAKTKPDNIGSLTSQFKFDEATELSFKAKSTGSLGVKVEKSLDGTTWTGEETFNLTTSAATKTYTISSAGEDVYLRFTLVKSTGTSTYRLTIDDIIVKGYGTPINNEDINGGQDSTNTNPDNGGLSSSDLSEIESTIKTYYASVGSSYTGETLWTKLKTATQPNKLTSYGDLRYLKGVSGSIGGNLNSDYDSADKTKLIDFYSGLSIPGAWDNGTTWNREHVWCQSHGWWGEVKNSDRSAGTDLHHLRPTISSINSSRNNSLYGEVPNRNSHAEYYSFVKGTKATVNDEGATLYGYIDASVDPRPSTSSNEGVFEPTDRMKGDVARIIMYMLVRYKGEATPVTNIIYTSQGTASAAYDLLLKWHEADPVSNFEIRRNNETYNIQGNRNPFIDNPSYANAIWG